MDLHPILAADVAAFFIIFGVFVVAMVVLAVLIVKWALAKDRPGREAWRQRHFQAQAQAEAQAGSAAPAGPIDGPRQPPPPGS
jgi:hypothetical protein